MKKKLVTVKKGEFQGQEGVFLYIDGDFSKFMTKATSLLEEIALVDALNDVYKLKFEV